MDLGWLDFVFMAILLVALIIGFIKGLIREIIGLVAVVLGLILAAFYYPYASRIFELFISHETLAHFLGFLLIFFAILAIAGLISHLLSKLMKGPFRFLNHFLGGIFGFLKGILVCGVIVFAFIVFPVSKEALINSYFAPYCFAISKAMVYLIPQDLRNEFKSAYQDIIQKVKEHGKKV